MAASLVKRVLDLAVAIQRIPAPTFAEGERASFVAERFRSEGLSEVAVDAVGNACACLPGEGHSRPLVVNAHLDTVFPAGTELKLTRTPKQVSGPGIGDNALGVAGLFGLVWALREGAHGRAGPSPSISEASPHGLPGDLWLVANVGEEGLGDLRGMRAVVDRFHDEPLAYIVLEGIGFGHIYHRSMGVRRYRISVRTPGGHSWGDYGAPSAIHELASLVNGLTSLRLPETPRTTLNVGVFTGGTSVNTLAPEASIEVDLRSVGVEQLANLTSRVEKIAHESNRERVQVSAEVIGDRPAGEIPPDHPLVRLAVESLERLGVEAELQIGSTDANIPLSRGFPAICLGLTRGGGSHSLEEHILTAPLGDGLAQVEAVVRGAFERLGQG